MKKNCCDHQKNIASALPTNYYWRYHGAQYPGFHWPSVETLLNLIYTYNLLEAHFAQRIAKYGLSLSAFNILMILSRGGNKSCKQRDLSKLLIVSRANITGLIDSLIRQGFVSRTEDPEDRRVCIAKITQAGEELLERLLPSHYQEIAQISSALSSGEKTKLIESLTKLRTNFFKMTGKTPS